MKLVQKHFPIGRREFEIAGDAVYVFLKGFLKEEKLCIDLSRLDPEPVSTGPELEFRGRDGRGYTLSLYVDRPDKASFERFVGELSQRISGLSGPDIANEASPPLAPGWNVYEEPMGFEEDDSSDNIPFVPVRADRLQKDIEMLKTYLDGETITPLINSLEALKAKPDNEAAFRQMIDAYKDSGISQGAVLTYAPYLKALLSQTSWV